MSELDLNKIVQTLSTVSEIPEQEIKDEIAKTQKEEGLGTEDAILSWKSNHSLELGKGTTDIIARVVHKNPERETSKGNVASIVIAHQDLDTGETLLKEISLWNERIAEYYLQFEVDKAYRFKASQNKDGRFTRLRNLVELNEPISVPRLDQITPTPLDMIPNQIGKVEVVSGRVSRLIKSQGQTEVIGVDIGTLIDLLPLTLWFGGKFRKVSEEEQMLYQSLKKGDVLKALGTINQSGTNISMQTLRVVRL